jgi:hypothetical protein
MQALIIRVLDGILLKYACKSSVVGCNCNPSYMGGRGKTIAVESNQAKASDLI